MSQKPENLKTLPKELFQIDRMIDALEARLRPHIRKQELLAVRRAVV